MDAMFAKAGTAIQGVKVNGTEITPDANKKVNLEVATTAQLNAEVAAREGAVSAEALARAGQDTTLGNMISAEETARIAEDLELETAIGTRAAAADLTAEVQARTAADTALQTEINGKQAIISDLATIRSGAAAGATAYQKPATGVPSTDMAAGVQSSLGKADTAVQPAAIANFITKSVDDLVNYYKKAETYTQAEVNALIAAISQFHYEIVAVLPATGQGNVLYLLGPTGTGADKYEEYVYSNNVWTKIGDTSVDLSGYVTTSALSAALANYTTTANLTTLLAAKQDSLSEQQIANIADVPNKAAASDVTALAGRVTTIEGKEADWDAKLSEAYFVCTSATTYQQAMVAYNAGKILLYRDGTGMGTMLEFNDSMRYFMFLVVSITPSGVKVYTKGISGGGLVPFTETHTLQELISSDSKLAASLISGLANVATSGSYDDLSDTPTIPTVPAIDTSIDAQSTDADTASAKAVYNFVQSAIVTTINTAI